MTLKIVYDADDTLWELNEKICKENNIDIRKIRDFSINKNDDLTRDEKDTLIKNYHNSDNFKNIQWNKGIDKIKNVEALSTDKVTIEVWIQSNSLTVEIADLKLPQLIKATGISEDRIILNVVDFKNSGKKDLKDLAWCLVDDSPEVILNSFANYRIIKAMPWNSRIHIDGKKILRQNNLMDIVSTIENLVKSEIERIHQYKN